MRFITGKIQLFLVGLFLLTKSVSAQEIPSRPNIIIILIDDMGWNDTGFSGNELIETPRLDSLADRGIIFTNAYAAAPNCAPSRASLLTGLYTPRHGIYTVNDPKHYPGMAHHKILSTESESELSDETVTIAEYLLENEYETGMVGMWNLGQGKSGPASPSGQGFETYAEPKKLGFEPNAYIDDSGRFLTDRLTDESIEYMRRNRDSPFFLYTAYHGIHAPFQPPQDLHDKYVAIAATQNGLPDDWADYAATVEAVDQNVGRIWRTVEELGQEDNTYLFFTSDNGGLHNYTHPLREGKGTLYEGGIRVPAFIIGPGIKDGRISNTPVSAIDFFPTIAELTKSAAYPSDGESLLPLILHERALERKALYWHFPSYIGRGGPVSALRTGDYKLIEFFETGETELYDLKNDPGENVDLSQIEIEKARELYSMLREWHEDLQAPRPGTPNPAYDPATENQRGPNRENAMEKRKAP